MEELTRRRSQTGSRLTSIRSRLESAEKLASKKACVYATGSYGRGEASQYSDLDLFIVGLARSEDKGRERRRSMLSKLDEVCIKADLINLTRELHIQDFSGEGQYLIHYSIDELTKSVGTPDDDATNTLTARLLLLLEGNAIVGQAVYQELIGEVISAYWRDYPDHKNCFMPAFLANDILRLWRTFCVNYEARTSRDPSSRKAKGKLHNYKLKHSRMLTCYSAILMLLFQFKANATVSPTDAMAIVSQTPTERLEWLLQRSESAQAHPAIEQLLAKYDTFLQITNAPEETLIEKFSDKAFIFERIKEASAFGESMFEALNKLGQGSQFYRLLVV